MIGYKRRGIITEEDKRLISEYMGWFAHPQGFWYDPPVYFTDSFRGKVKFDLNDAGLCVKEMQRRRDDYVEFIKFAYDMAFNAGNTQFHTVTAWLYNADNFFEVMAKWLKEKKNEQII